MKNLFESAYEFIKNFGNESEIIEPVIDPMDDAFMRDVLVQNDVQSFVCEPEFIPDEIHDHEMVDPYEYKCEDGCVDKGLNRCALAATCLANNMKHVHLHVSGPRFDSLHEIAQNYYDKAGEDADQLFELALEQGEKVDNPAYANANLNWHICVEDNYNSKDALETISDNIKHYLGYLLRTRENQDNFVQVNSVLDNIIQFWSLELGYKMKRRLIDSDTAVLEENFDYQDYELYITQNGTVIKDKYGKYIMTCPTEEEAIEYINDNFLSKDEREDS